MIPAVSQRLKLTAENSITRVSKLVGKAPVRRKIFLCNSKPLYFRKYLYPYNIRKY